MKAAVVTQDHQVDVTEKTLRPLRHGEALLKMECCGVCHTDLHVKNGDFGDKTGVILGHEGIGVVAEVGPGVTSLKPGDRASVAWFYEGCGHCEYCNTGNETLCRNVKNAGYTVDGGMAEECIVVADYAVKVPEGLDSAAASSITCAGVTTYKAVKISHIKPGQWIAMVGTRQDLTDAFQFAAEGKVVPKVALRPLEDINVIFKEMEQGQIRGRMVIDFRR
ncbi:alcohol dehydrogenase AdhP [Salmonella enterica]|nr:alcohol dehydrogenase AdhP [Salmonella enterica]EBG6423572.1 alcohol dehydrogenase AdhP [Salmonella enterica]EIO7798544.1 alcohol dehydrogenase catalytic domain-containing protein [Salmonella enterica]EIY9057688.1 alcohol dehydrogenase catalytic domain-containing protein [Salmonella enterica]